MSQSRETPRYLRGTIADIFRVLHDPLTRKPRMERGRRMIEERECNERHKEDLMLAASAKRLRKRVQRIAITHNNHGGLSQ